MLRVSKLTDYATVILTYMAHQPDEIYAATDITKVTGIALPTVSKVMKLLAKETVVISRRGSKGGYVLAAVPVNINVARIIVAMEGAISLTECTTDEGLCDQESSCEIKGNWNVINRAVFTALEAVTLADLKGSVKNQAVNVALPSMPLRSVNNLKVES